MRFGYRLYDGEGQLRADGFTVHLWLDRESRRPVVAPVDVMRFFEPFRSKE